MSFEIYDGAFVSQVTLSCDLASEQSPPSMFMWKIAALRSICSSLIFPRAKIQTPPLRHLYYHNSTYCNFYGTFGRLPRFLKFWIVFSFHVQDLTTPSAPSILSFNKATQLHLLQFVTVHVVAASLLTFSRLLSPRARSSRSSAPSISPKAICDSPFGRLPQVCWFALVFSFHVQDWTRFHITQADKATQLHQ